MGECGKMIRTVYLASTFWDAVTGCMTLGSEIIITSRVACDHRLGN